MVDRFVLSAPLRISEWARVAERCRLEEYTRSGEIFYVSGKESRFDALHITIKDKGITIKGSLHKFYNRTKNGKADNSGMFTMEQAKEAFQILAEFSGVPLFECGKLTSYEIGYNIKTRSPAIEYIQKIQSIGVAKEPLLYEDIRFKKDRQKSTRRDKNKRKYYKIYDKQYEVKLNQGREIPNTLRIETAYKRQSVKLADLLSREGIAKTEKHFIRSWQSVVFVREYSAKKGVKKSQADRAIQIKQNGKNAYLTEEKKRHTQGIITDKQYRISKEFVRDFDTLHYDKVEERLSIEEIEYQNAVNQIYRAIKEVRNKEYTPKWSKGK